LKNDQHNYEDSVKRKNYFYPHVGAGGGAGGMRKTRGRDSTPLKFTLTTLSQSTNQSRTNNGQIIKMNSYVGSSCCRIKAKARELKLIGDGIGDKQRKTSLFPRVKNPTEVFSPNDKGKVHPKTRHLMKSYGKSGQNTLAEQLSTTVATTGHNTGLGWNNEKINLTEKIKFNKMKIINNLIYNHENKFFPRRNISSKLKYLHGAYRKGNKKIAHKFAPKGYIIEKENNGQNIKITEMPIKVAGSVPSRTSSKAAFISYAKVSPSQKHTYFSPNFKPAAYQNHYPQYNMPTYKR
jgi:hypothetical protein